MDAKGFMKPVVDLDKSYVVDEVCKIPVSDALPVNQVSARLRAMNLRFYHQQVSFTCFLIVCHQLPTSIQYVVSPDIVKGNAVCMPAKYKFNVRVNGMPAKHRMMCEVNGMPAKDKMSLFVSVFATW